MSCHFNLFQQLIKKQKYKAVQSMLNGGKFEIFKDINRSTLIFKNVNLPFIIFIAVLRQAAWQALTTLYGELYHSYLWIPQVMFLNLYWNSEGFSWLGQVKFWPVSLVDEFELICTVCKVGKICRADNISRFMIPMLCGRIYDCKISYF